MEKLSRKISNEGTVHYYFTSKKLFKRIGSLDASDINVARDFAYNMTFGGQGQHRASRTGGNHSRMNAEIFLNVFNGKLGEFAIKRYLENLHFEVPPVDVDIYGLGKWDNNDFEIHNYKLSVKTIKDFSHLLLLEKGDWDANGCYIPNKDSDGGLYDYHIVARLKGNRDLEKELKSKRKFFSILTKEEVDELVKGYRVEYDLPGIATREMLIEAIKNEQIIKQNEYITNFTKVQADNYYIQSGDLFSIEQLIKVLKEIKDSTDMTIY